MLAIIEVVEKAPNPKLAGEFQKEQKEMILSHAGCSSAGWLLVTVYSMYYMLKVYMDLKKSYSKIP